MMPILNEETFWSVFYKYYAALEADFKETERYVAFDKDNFSIHSIEYVKQIQAICSEVDAVFKSLCDINGNESSSIGTYFDAIQANYPEVFNAEKFVSNSNITLKPWEAWTKQQPPKWWTYYNKIKHKRTVTQTETNKPYYKFANLENVLNGIAALHILLEVLYKRIQKNQLDKFYENPENVIQSGGHRHYDYDALQSKLFYYERDRCTWYES